MKFINKKQRKIKIKVRNLVLGMMLAANVLTAHGAGRIMSRSEAKKNLTLEEYQNTMKGISSRTVCQKTIDEAPQVYKDAKEIENLISETVEIQKHLKVIANYKGF